MSKLTSCSARKPCSDQAGVKFPIESVEVDEDCVKEFEANRAWQHDAHCKLGTGITFSSRAGPNINEMAKARRQPLMKDSLSLSSCSCRSSCFSSAMQLARYTKYFSLACFLRNVRDSCCKALFKISISLTLGSHASTVPLRVQNHKCHMVLSEPKD